MFFFLIGCFCKDSCNLNEDIEQIMEENRVALNDTLPAYSQISKMKIYPEEFEKTPKKSIKRYLYQEAKG